MRVIDHYTAIELLIIYEIKKIGRYCSKNAITVYIAVIDTVYNR
jgi:hypothetical protein